MITGTALSIVPASSVSDRNESRVISQDQRHSSPTSRVRLSSDLEAEIGATLSEKSKDPDGLGMRE